MVILMANLAMAAPTEVGSPRPFGLGIQLGTFSGVTGKVYLRGRKTAVDFALGTAYGRSLSDSVHAQVSFHEHFGPLTSGSGVTIPWRIGVGGWINAGSYWVYPNYDNVIVGVRAPVGVDFDLEDAPVQFYVEVAFDLSIVPGVSGGLDASAGVRYYF